LTRHSGSAETRLTQAFTPQHHRRHRPLVSGGCHHEPGGGHSGGERRNRAVCASSWG
jgi:hypothetical protein